VFYPNHEEPRGSLRGLGLWNSSRRNRIDPQENRPIAFLLSAGEASGDTYGAQLIYSLKQLVRPAAFFGMGGEKMHAAGCELLVNAQDVAVVGLAEGAW